MRPRTSMSQFTDEAVRSRYATYRALAQQEQDLNAEIARLHGERDALKPKMENARAALASAIMDGPKPGRILIDGALIHAQVVMGTPVITREPLRTIAAAS